MFLYKLTSRQNLAPAIIALKMDDFSEKNEPSTASKKAVFCAEAVSFITVDEAGDNQRVDNFLLARAKGVPKSHIYRVVRSGEVRVNKKRVKAETRLTLGDIVRIPPLRVAEKKTTAIPAFKDKELPVLFEDASYLIVDKPSGLAAHGGSGISFGLIEKLRASRPEAPFLELCHRLDRDTSGAIVIAKTRKALVRFQALQKDANEIEKHYRLLVIGDWVNEREHVKFPLYKYTLPSGERRVRVDKEKGLASHTIFTVIKRYGKVTLLDAELKTGRTHQIRVHAATSGFPIAGDEKYGDYATNENFAKGSFGVPLKRLFLHAHSIAFIHPLTGEKIHVVSPLPHTCESFLAAL